MGWRCNRPSTYKFLNRNTEMGIDIARKSLRNVIRFVYVLCMYTEIILPRNFRVKGSSENDDSTHINKAS